MTIDNYLDEAVCRIDKQFGEGYAKNNPMLVAGFIRACADDFNTMMMRQAIDEASSAIHSIAYTIDNCDVLRAEA
jgi:hypothetical protein